MTDKRVRDPANPLLREKLAELQRRFPVATDHLRAFRSTGSRFVFAAQHQGPDGSICWFVLVRLAPQYESSFGITQPVGLAYMAVHDVQPRHIDFIRRTLILADSRPDRNLVLVSSPDRRLEEKVDEWNSAAFSVVPIPEPLTGFERYPDQIVESIRRRVYTRDLYFESTPVSGDRFFGRDVLVKSVVADVLSGRSPAIFGVRKSGKTSLLRHLQETLTSRAQAELVFIYRDLEHVPSPPADPVPDVVRDLATDLAGPTRGFSGTGKLSAVLESPTPSDFRRAMDQLLQRNPSTLIVVAFDEVEYLLPPDESMVRTEPIPAIPQLLGALRSLAQENANFRFLLAGTTNWILEQGTLFGRPNPLLAWSKPYYMEPFVTSETGALLKGIGVKVGTIWDDGAVAEVQGRTGGHAFLVRSLASHVLQELPLQAKPRRVTKAQVAMAVNRWQREHHGLVQEWMDQIDRYYPTESFLLEALVEDRGVFHELAAENPIHRDRLIRLGLVLEDPSGSMRPSGALLGRVANAEVDDV